MYNLQWYFGSICNTRKKIFLYDYGWNILVYLLKQKSNAFGIFKKFKALVEKESGKHIKELRYEKGGEFNSNDLLEFCKYRGIKR